MMLLICELVVAMFVLLTRQHHTHTHRPSSLTTTPSSSLLTTTPSSSSSSSHMFRHLRATVVVVHNTFELDVELEVLSPCLALPDLIQLLGGQQQQQLGFVCSIPLQHYYICIICLRDMMANSHDEQRITESTTYQQQHNSHTNMP